MTILIKLRLHTGRMGGILNCFHNRNFREFLHQAGGNFWLPEREFPVALQ